MTARLCKCGAEVTVAEIRVVERCEHGHFVASNIAPTRVNAATIAPAAITPGQQRALHAKANKIDRLRGRGDGTRKKELLGDSSSNDLNESEASELLDLLEAELSELLAGAGASSDTEGRPVGVR